MEKWKALTRDRRWILGTFSGEGPRHGIEVLHLCVFVFSHNTNHLWTMHTITHCRKKH